MVRAVLFDFDDTLVKTRECKFAAIREVGTRFYGYSLKDSDIEAHWGKPFNHLFEGVFSSIDPDVARVVERYLSVSPDFPMIAYEDAVATLDQLCAIAEVGILTAASRKVVLQDLQRLGFPTGRFVSVQCFEDSEYHKPDARVFDPILSILQKKKVDLQEVVYVGDSLSDYVAASTAGIRFIGCYHPNRRADPFLNLEVQKISQLSELIPMLNAHRASTCP